MSSTTSARGFTLFETLIATGILVTALAGIAQLFVLGTHLTRQATASGVALVAAQDKLESLRGLAFTYDASGAAATAAALQLSAPASLDEDVQPNVDFLDAGGGAAASAEVASFVRRWKISSVATSDPEAIAIEVCVFNAPAHGVDHRAADACLAAVRTRQP